MGRTRRIVHHAATRINEPTVLDADVDASEFGYLSPAPRQRRWNFRHAGAFRTQTSIDPTAMATASTSAAMEWKSTWPDVKRRSGKRINRLTEFWDIESIPNLAPGARTGHISSHVTYDGFLSANPKYSGWISCHASQP